MAESEARGRVLNWVEDLHWWARSTRFWEEEQERIVWGHVALFCPAAFERYDLHGDCHSTVRLQSASNRLSSLHSSDIQVWTDGSVPSLFGPGGAGVYVTCSKCHTSNFLSFSTGPIASSFTAETFALKQSLDWCTNHLLTCKFQSVLFLTDSQSALSILSSAPSPR